MDELVAQGATRPAAAEKRFVAVESFLADLAVPGLNSQQHRLPVPTASSDTHTSKYTEGERQGARGAGAVGQLLAFAQTQWAGLVNVPVGSTDFGFTLGSTAGANINQSESPISTPAETDGSTGLSQSGFDNQRLFENGNFPASGPSQTKA
jgi:hypothetical protein